MWETRFQLRQRAQNPPRTDRRIMDAGHSWLQCRYTCMYMHVICILRNGQSMCYPTVYGVHVYECNFSVDSVIRRGPGHLVSQSSLKVQVPSCEQDPVLRCAASSDSCRCLGASRVHVHINWWHHNCTLDFSSTEL